MAPNCLQALKIPLTRRRLTHRHLQHKIVIAMKVPVFVILKGSAPVILSAALLSF
jgi:hypothetical protein